MSFIPENFMDWVVSISKKIATIDENWNQIEQFQVIATWILFWKKINEASYNIYLVTNRHVIEWEKWQLYLKFKHTNWIFVEKQISTHDENWISKFKFHPNNQIDVAVTELDYDRILREESIVFFYPEDISCYKKSDFIEHNISEWDWVFVIWYPSSLVWNNKFSLVRKWIISQIRPFKESITSDYLVDCFIFPWNSGGPVIIKPEIYWVGESQVNNQARLIWIIKGFLPYRESLQSTQTWKILSVTEQNSWLGLVESVDSITETIELNR